MPRLPHMSLPVAQEKQQEANNRLEKSAKDPGFVRLGAGRIDVDQIADFMGPPKPWGTHSVPSFLAPFLVLNNVTQTAASRFREKEAKPKIWDDSAQVLDSWLSVLCLYMFQEKLGINVKFTSTHLHVNDPLGDARMQQTSEQAKAQRSKKADATQDIIRAFKTAGRLPFDPQGGNPPFWFLTELQAQFGGQAHTFAIVDDELMLCPTILSSDAFHAFRNYVPWYSTGKNKIREHLIETGFGERRLTARGQMLYNTLKTMEAHLNAPAPGIGNIQLLIRYLELAGNAVKSVGVPFPPHEEEKTYKYLGDGKDDPSYREQQMHISPSLGVITRLFLDRAVKSRAPGIESTWTDEAVLVPLNDEQFRAFERNFRTAPLLIPNLLPVDGTRLYLLPPVHNEIYEYLHNTHGESSATVVQGPRVTVRSEAARALFKVEVTMSFLDQEREEITRIHEYVISLTPEIKSTLWLMDSLPYLSLWPDVDLPMDKWGLYLVAQGGGTLDGYEKLLKLLRSLVTDAEWRMRLRFETGELENSGRFIWAKDLKLKIDQVEPKQRMARVPNVPPWTVHQCNARPNNIKLFAPDGERVISSLNLNPIPENDPQRQPGTSTEKYQVALDFGTSSSLMWIAPMRANGSGTQRSVISGADYVNDLFVQTVSERKESFCRYCWIRKGGETMNGDRELDLLGKVNSIAIVYGETSEPMVLNRAKDIIPFVNGSILRRDVKVSEDVTDTYKPLTDFGVYAGLKFFDVEDDRTSLGDNRYWDDALCLYFAHLLTLAALDARMSGVANGNLSLVAAGPDRGVFERMNMTLLQTLALMNKEQFKHVYDDKPVKVYAEANAVHAYMEEIRPAASCFVPGKGGVIVDIGGGTVDIYIAHGKGTKPVHESFHLAGDRLIRRAIVYASAKYPPGGSSLTPRRPGLEELSMLLAEADKSKVSEDLRKRFLISYEKAMSNNNKNPQNENERWLDLPPSAIDVRNMYPSLAELVDVLMSEFPPRYDLVTTQTNLQTGSVGGSTTAVSMVAVSEVLKLHYLLLFCLVAELLKKHGRQLDLEHWDEIDIFLSGFGARGLGFCCGISLDMPDGECANSLFFTEVLSSVIKKVAGTESSRIRFVMPFEREKLEVVRGLFCKPELLKPAFNEVGNVGEQSNMSGDASTSELTTTLVKTEAEKLEKLYGDAIESIPKNNMTRWFRSHYKTLLQDCEGFAETGYGSQTSFDSIRHDVINYAKESRLLEVFDTQSLGVWYWLKVIELAIRRWGELPEGWKNKPNQEKRRGVSE